jgi:Predicted dinucleotide-utilizing enzyme of the ThiF/HesA family
MSLEEMEKAKAPWGEVTLVGLGRLGLRTALTLMQAHRGGPKRITAIDEQKISPDDFIFRQLGAKTGEYKVKFLERLAGPGYSKEIVGVPKFLSDKNLDLIRGDVVCIEMAGGDTLPLTAKIIRHAQAQGMATISTMGVFGVGNVAVSVADIDSADPLNPIVKTLRKAGIHNHVLVGTGKLIRDWEPVIPPVLDRVSLAISSEVLRLLEQRK